nr:MAG TPA: hypothetical protein [Caudoviricetes sp.]
MNWTIAVIAAMDARIPAMVPQKALRFATRYSSSARSPASVRRTLTEPPPPHQYWPGFSTG